MSEPALHRFADGPALLGELCAQVDGLLRTGIAARGQAAMLVSGGRTPGPMFDRLSREDLQWSRVGIGMVDERCVPPDSADSNEKSVRDRLLQHHAAAANFVPMMNDDPPATRAALAWRRLQALAWPLDLALLGMGDDGHTASWFPGSAALATALDPAQAPNCLSLAPVNAPHERLTVNFSALMQARRIIVLINGASKLRVYEAALAAGDMQDMPVRAVLRQQRVPVDVYWSP